MKSRRAPTPVRSARLRSGFTLIELLVVIAIIALLVALLLPAVQQAREAARRSQCANNLKNIALAIHNFEEVNQTLPSSRRGPQHATWFVQILPHLEQKNLFDQWTLSDSYYVQSAAAQQTSLPVFYCPSRRSAMLSTLLDVSSTGVPDTLEHPGALGDYAGNGGQFYDSIVDNPLCRGAMCSAASNVVNHQVVDSKSQTRLRDVTDGTTQTLLVGEKHVPRIWYGQSGPNGDGAIYNGDYPRSYSRIAGNPKFNLGTGPDDVSGPWHCKFGSDHAGLCQFAFVDGHVGSVNTSISLDALNRLAVRDDGTPAGVDP